MRSSLSELGYAARRRREIDEGDLVDMLILAEAVWLWAHEHDHSGGPLGVDLVP